MTSKFSIIQLETIDSTNNYATKLVHEKKAVDKQVIVTRDQTQGRGYSENAWVSEPNCNLMLSIVLFPQYLKTINQFYLSKAVSLAVTDFLANFSNNVTIKWPNDIYINDKKICGILIENSMMGDRFYHSVIGIGMNINQLSFSSKLPNPTSLALETRKTFDISEMLDLFLNALSVRLAELEQEQFDKLSANYLQHLYRLNKLAKFVEKSNTFDGTIVGIEELGQLIIAMPNGSKRNFLFKEIEYVL